MTKKKKSKFGANVVADVERRKKEGSAYGYLNLPKGLTMFKESEGKLRLDIIPYMVTDKNHLDANEDSDIAMVGEPWYKKPILSHRNIGANNESVICLRTVGKKCPICEQRDKQFKEGMDKEDVVPKAQLRNLYLVIPIGHKEYKEEIHLWDISDYLFQQKLDEELEEDPDQGIFPDPEEGKTLRVRFSEESYAKNKYYETSRIDFEEREDQYDEDIIEEAPNLDEIFTVHPYKKLEAMFYELDEDDVAEDDKEDTPFEEEENTTKRKPKSLRKKIPEPEEEEDEKPKKKGKREGKKEKNKCPYKHVFGKEWDEFDDCDDCDKFDDCGEANED